MCHSMSHHFSGWPSLSVKTKIQAIVCLSQVLIWISVFSQHLVSRQRFISHIKYASFGFLKWRDSQEMVNWMLNESQQKVDNLTKFQNSYKHLTEADYYLNFRFTEMHHSESMFPITLLSHLVEFHLPHTQMAVAHSKIAWDINICVSLCCRKKFKFFGDLQVPKHTI